MFYGFIWHHIWWFGLVSFLNMAQPLYQETYQVGDKFPFYFASIAKIIGVSSFINAKLVDKICLQVIVTYALIWVWAWSAIFLLISYFNGSLDLVTFLVFTIPTFGTYGFLFSNVNTLALMPMGHIAGTAAAVIGTCSNILAIIIGACATYFFVGTPKALITVFFLGATLNIFILLILKQFKVKLWSNA
jgi:DHA1 family bicyclomycin/chloramphenicol resistance-like MFS transporter